MKFGLFVPQGWRMDLTEIEDRDEKYEAMTDVARAADDGPWDSAWLFDHMHTVPTATQEECFEAWISTAGLLRDTRRIHIGQMVSCNGYRQPSLLAKMASTAHVAGRGRLYTGLGAGWAEEEWRAYGYDWTSTAERMRAFAESVEIIRRLWTEDEVIFTGRHHRVNGPVNEPKGFRGTHPPLWVGGSGERVTLKLVAEHADACNFGRGDPQVIRQKMDVLRKHCHRAGTDFDSITKSTSISAFPVSTGADLDRATKKARGRVTMQDFRTRAVAGSPPDTRVEIADSDVIKTWIDELLDVGIDYVIVYIPGVANDHDPMHRFADEIIPAFA